MRVKREAYTAVSVLSITVPYIYIPFGILSLVITFLVKTTSQVNFARVEHAFFLGLVTAILPSHDSYCFFS